MPRPEIGSVPFKEAIDYFESKTLVPTRHWDQMLGEMHGRAFTVAGVTKIEMLNDFKQSILEIRKRGGTITDFRKDFDQIVARYGWPYKGKRGWRTKVIFETNMRTSNAAGRWAQIQRRQAKLKKADPSATLYLQYKVLDNSLRRRPEHQAWEDIILPVDHPFWDTHYPINGYGCACYIVVLSERQLKQRGLKVTKNVPSIRRTERVNSKSGEIYPPTPEGIDVGFDHHHGKSAYFPNASNMLDDRLGHKVAEINVNSGAFEKLVTGQVSGNALVGYLPDGLSDLIGSKTNRVYLSDNTITKQLVNHPEVKLKDYKSLPDVFRTGLVVKQKTQTLVFIHIGSEIYRAAVKSTKDGKELYVTSLLKTSQKEIDKLRRNGKVVREEI